jgi:hypothetical protein
MPLTPVRICDSRTAGVGIAVNPCQGLGQAASPLGPGGVKTIQVSGSNTVPATAVAAVLNVTVTDTTAASFLTVWPTGAPQPTASNINWKAGQTVPNLVQVGLSASGSVNIFNSLGSTNVVVDLEGYFDSTATSLFNALTPVRLCDTRSVASGSVANECQGAGGVAATLGVGTMVVPVGGFAGVPATATAAVVNVTVTNTSAPGFLTVWPDGTAKPVASNVNWKTGKTNANRVTVSLPADGKIDIFNSGGTTDVIVDVNGYYSTAAGGSGYLPFPPTRACDTRPVGPGVILNGCNDPSNGGPGPLGDQDEIVLPVPSDPNFPISALVLNVTIADETEGTFLTVFPDADPNNFVSPPVVSDLNATPGFVVANLSVVSGSQGSFAIYNDSGDTNIVVDVEGAYSTAAPASSEAVVAHSLAARVTRG